MSPARIAPDKLRIAVAFFGITRSLRLTLGSIRRNLIEPARSIAPTVRLFGHFYDQQTIENPRSGETGPLDQDEYKLLELDEVEREPPELCLSRYAFETLKASGDPWRDRFVSLRNLVHQLHSLRRVTELAMTWKPHIVIFARPDLYYHDSAAPHLAVLAGLRRQRVLVPDWSLWHGYNDRFAIAKGDDPILAYGNRVDRIADYCAVGKKPHAERLLKFALADVPTRTMPMRASRVRSNGLVVVEDFEPGRGKGGEQTVLPFEAFERSLPLAARHDNQGSD